MTSLDKAVSTTIDLVFSSQRVMPAHYSGDDERSKSFFIDFEMDADDEYEIASQTFYVMHEYLGKIPANQLSRSDTSAVLKVGEDLAVGAFILQKITEYASFSDLHRELIEENLSLWDEPRLYEVMDMPMVKNYLDFCSWFGRARAYGFRWGNKN